MDIWQILFNSQANTSSSKTSHVWDEATYSASDGTHLIQILIYQLYDKQCDTLGKFSIG